MLEKHSIGLFFLELRNFLEWPLWDTCLSIHSGKHWPRGDRVPGTILGPQDIFLNQAEQVWCPGGLKY